MEARLLPRSEYPRLVGTELETVAPQLPASSRVWVLEEATQIVGCHSLFPALHAEGLWLHPQHRSLATLRVLWRAVKADACEHFQVKAITTAAMTDDVRRLLAYVHGVKVPGDHYIVPIGD